MSKLQMSHANVVPNKANNVSTVLYILFHFLFDVLKEIDHLKDSFIGNYLLSLTYFCPSVQVLTNEL